MRLELLQIALGPLDCLARRFAQRLQLARGELGNRRADVQNRAGTQVALDAIQLALALRKNVGADRAALDVHPIGFVEQAAGANIVPADDQVFPVEQVESSELSEGTYQADRLDQPLFQCDESGQGRGGDATFGAEQPKSNTSTGHN